MSARSAFADIIFWSLPIGAISPMLFFDSPTAASSDFGICGPLMAYCITVSKMCPISFGPISSCTVIGIFFRSRIAFVIAAHMPMGVYKCFDGATGFSFNNCLDMFTITWI